MNTLTEEQLLAAQPADSLIPPAVNATIDRLEEAMIASYPRIEMPVTHQFTPGLYIRTITMPAGAYATSKIHKKEHPYCILKGKVLVWTGDQGLVEITAPYQGITPAGTRRALHVVEECVWVTFHPTDKKTVEEVEEEIIEKHENPLLKELSQ